MSPAALIRRYSRAEHLSDVAVHGLGLLGALGFLPVLIWLALGHEGGWPVMAACLVYGLSLVAMLTCSALYNGIEGRWTPLFRRLDHSAIYLKIAGTYTPLVALTGAGAWLLLGLWGAAFGGLSLKLVSPDRWRWLGLALYVAMGWVGVLAGGEMLAALDPLARGFVIGGGLLYTAGIGFYLWERLPFHNTIWHGFVVIASAAFGAAIARQLVSLPVT